MAGLAGGTFVTVRAVIVVVVFGVVLPVAEGRVAVTALPGRPPGAHRGTAPLRRAKGGRGQCQPWPWSLALAPVGDGGDVSLAEIPLLIDLSELPAEAV